MSEIPNTEQLIEQSTNEQFEQDLDFAYMRKKDNLNYRNLCRTYAKMIDPPNLEKLAFFIIKKPGDRYEEEVNILHKWTSRFKFFQELNTKQSNVDMRIHEKCCMKMKYEKILKGNQVFMAGDIPEKFYIVISGSVNVLLQKSNEVLQREILKSKEQFKKSTSKDQSNSIQARVSRLMKKREVIRSLQNKVRSSMTPKQDQDEDVEDEAQNQIQQNGSEEEGNEYKRNDSLLIEIKRSISPKKEEHSDKFQRNNSSRLKTQVNNEEQVLPQIQSPEKYFEKAIFRKNEQKKSNLFAPVRKSQLYQESILGNQLSQGNPSQSEITSQQSIDLASPKRGQNRAHNKLQELYRNSIFMNQQQNTPYGGFNEYLEFRKLKEPSKPNQLTPQNNEKLSPSSPLNHQRLSQKQSDCIENVMDSSRNSVRKSTCTNQGSQSSVEDFQDIDPEEKDLENDPVFNGLGKIKLSDINEPQKFIQEGVLKHTYLTTVERGQMFGELGLLMKKPRAATIIVKEDTEFAVLGAEDYIQILQAGEMKKFNRRINFFSSSLLQNCGREVVVKFSYNFEKHKYEKGQNIYTQNESPKFVYLIKKGTIKISKRLEVNETIEDVFDYGYKNPLQEQRKDIKFFKQQKQFIDIMVNEYTTGQSFGEMEVMYECPRTTSAICTSLTATIYALSIKNFLVLLHENKFLVKDFQKQIHMKEEYQKNKIKQYLDSIKQQNELNKQHIQDRERIIIKNRKFNKYKENPTIRDTVFKPSFTELNISDDINHSYSPRRQNNQQTPELHNYKSTSPTRQNQYSPSNIQLQSYINEKGNRQIDVSDELFENSAFSQFLQQGLKIKKQNLQKFFSNKGNSDESINNSEIFTSMLYVEQIRKQMNMNNMMYDANKFKPGMVKLKKIIHQNGIDLKDTINLELLLLGDDVIKQMMNSPPQSSRSISIHQQSRQDNIHVHSDHINESHHNYENTTNDYLDRSPSQNSEEFTKLMSSNKDSKSTLNNSNSIDIGKSSQSSPKNPYYNLDWQQFVQKYKHKLKNLNPLEKKQKSLKKTYSNAISDRFFQETLKQKQQEQYERTYYLKTLQNTFEQKQAQESDKKDPNFKDISRDSYFFSQILNKDIKQKVKENTIDNQSLTNTDNSTFIGGEDGFLQNQQFQEQHKDNQEQQRVKNKIQVLEELEYSEEKTLHTPNKLPKIEQQSNSNIFSRADLDKQQQQLDFLKTVSFIGQPKNLNEPRKISPNTKLLDSSRKSPSTSLSTKSIYNKGKRFSFENKVIQNKLLQSQKKDVNPENQQQEEYYVHSYYIKPNLQNEPIVTSQRNYQSPIPSQFNSTQFSRIKKGNSLLAQIDMSCGFQNQQTFQQTQTSIQDESSKSFTQKPQNTFDILKILSKHSAKSNTSPPKNTNSVIINTDNNQQSSNLKQNNSLQQPKLREKTLSQRNILIRNNQSQDRKTLSIQSETARSMISGNNNIELLRGEQMRDNVNVFSNLGFHSPDHSNDKTIYMNEIKKSMSFTSKHNMFRTKPTKLYLIDRYSRTDSKTDLKNQLKPINHLIDMQIKKLKLQNAQSMNNYQ